MKGIELSKKYFYECGLPILEAEFKDVFPLLAFGFVGSGSDRYGYDDEISKDHDFEPGFCIFTPDDDILDRRTSFLLERAYAKLPEEYLGYKRQKISPVGGNRNGVIKISEFYSQAVGNEKGQLSLYDWLRIDDFSLAEATNGEVFLDNYGEFSSIREYLKNMPEDIRLKKIAGNLLSMAQSGQYNYLRIVKRGEYEAAQFAVNEFVNSTMKVIFLLNRKYMPYYKWSFRALRDLIGDVEIVSDLSYLLFGNNGDSEVSEKKYLIIEQIATDIITELQNQDLTKAICADLEKHAYSVNDKIEDANIRNLNIFAGV